MDDSYYKIQYDEDVRDMLLEDGNCKELNNCLKPCLPTAEFQKIQCILEKDGNRMAMEKLIGVIKQYKRMDYFLKALIKSRQENLASQIDQEKTNLLISTLSKTPPRTSRCYPIDASQANMVDNSFNRNESFKSKPQPIDREMYQDEDLNELIFERYDTGDDDFWVDNVSDMESCDENDETNSVN